MYKAPQREYEFILHEVLKISTWINIKGYGDLDKEFTDAIISEASKLAERELFPSNSDGDKIGVKYSRDTKTVTTPESYKKAFAAMKASGWTGVDCDEVYGGQGMPHILSTIINEIFSSGNQALAMYSGLTHGAYSAIHTHGTQEQKNMYLPKLISGEWTGTMNLTEPQCGTDLGLIKTKATPGTNGNYKISGTKIFITAGEHDLSQNIIHLVLARLPDAPEGVKGISLFVVPKFLINENGTLGDRNSVYCDKIEEKMGIHGSATCTMNYEEATGYLIGEPHKGLRAMFTMMNEARLLVGLQGLSQAEVAHQYAYQYAHDRLQGNNPLGDKTKTVSIIEHSDVKRNLIEQKAMIEGIRTFLIWSASFIDEEKRSENKQANERISLLIPVLKSFLTDKGFEISVNAQQVFGGHGYLEDWPMSQFVRDSRISMIYEGTNGVQALDLVGRKLPQNGGRAMMDLLNEIKEYCKRENYREDFSRDFISPLKDASKALQSVCMYFVMNGMKDPLNPLVGAKEFLDMFGYLMVGYSWAKMAEVCYGKEDEYYHDKLNTGKFYMKRILPKVYYYEKVIMGDSHKEVMNYR